MNGVRGLLVPKVAQSSQPALSLIGPTAPIPPVEMQRDTTSDSRELGRHYAPAFDVPRRMSAALPNLQGVHLPRARWTLGLFATTNASRLAHIKHMAAAYEDHESLCICIGKGQELHRHPFHHRVPAICFIAFYNLRCGSDKSLIYNDREFPA